MTYSRFAVRRSVALALVSFCFSSFQVAAQEGAKLYSKQGEVTSKSETSADWKAIDIGYQFQNADVLKTGDASRAALLFNDGLMVRLNEKSTFKLKLSSSGATPSSLAVEQGDAHFFSRKAREFPQIKTPLVSASIRGTEFTVSAAPSASAIVVMAGAVHLENQFGAVDLQAGERGDVAPGKAPVKSIIIHPENAVQWALYYPEVITEDDLKGISQDDAKALRAAARSLKTGQVMQAQSLLQSVRARTSDSALLLSQEAIIDLAQNRSADALSKAEKAYAAQPNSVAAALALSFALQNEKDLGRARSVIEASLKQYPSNSDLLTQHAEILLSFGESKEAWKQANRAVQLDASSARALTAKGFGALARGKFSEASEAFDRAIAISDGDGLPHLGQGLVAIRSGDLHEGRMAIQQAVHLEPNRAIFRSYLGKALYEEEHDTLAEEEFSRAIALDSNDPTPLLYRAYQRLSTNRPIEALEDIETSIEKNESRAVYRSALLLDQDSAVKSSSLAEVYSLLGFEQLARVEAMKSLSKDYTNPAAHLLLSKSYDVGDQFIQASLSEFYIARLLSPVNFNLVRPSSVGVVSSNEYTALFERELNRTSVQLNGESFEEQVNPGLLFSGTSGKWGYGLSYNYNYQDGFRDNDSENEHALYGTVQYQLTPDDTVILETNFESFKDGDTELEYDPETNNSDMRVRFDDFFVRLGGSHSFGSESKFIGQFVVNHSNLSQRDATFDRFLFAYLQSEGEVTSALDIDALVSQRIRFKSDGMRGDLQHLYSGSLLSNVVGVGLLTSDQEQTDSAEISTPEELERLPIGSDAENTESSIRAFDYTTFHLAKWLDFEVGVSFTRLHLSASPVSVPFPESTETMTEWDPKVGVVIVPMNGTTFRAGYFETVGTAGVREFELIEPTVISGFNQTFFDIYPGTRSRNSAFGLDQKLPARTYIGATGYHREISRRFPISVSQLFFDEESLDLVDEAIFLQDFDAHLEEDVVRGYLYKLFGKSFAATSEYIWSSDHDRFSETDVDTDRVELGVNYFRAGGFLAFAHATWRNQELDGFDADEAGDMDRARDFWVVDCGVGYRFPHRRGVLTLSLNNIFDQDFKYIPTGLEQEVLPGFGASLKFSYNF